MPPKAKARASRTSGERRSSSNPPVGRASSPGPAGRSSSPAPTTVKIFEAELMQFFQLLCRFGQDAADRSESRQLSAEAWTCAQGLLTQVSSLRSAAGSGASGVKHKKSSGTDGDIDYLIRVAHAEFPDGASNMDFTTFHSWQCEMLKECSSSFQHRRNLLQVVLVKVEHLEARRCHLAALAVAETADQLSQALKNASPILGSTDAELVSHRQRLEAMQQPFPVLLSTLSGDEKEVVVSRTQLVGEVRDAAAQAFETKSYRIMLACCGANELLQDDNASLEACGITDANTNIAVAFSEENPYREMPISEFMDLLTKNGVCTDAECKRDRSRLAEGRLTEADFVLQYTSVMRMAFDSADYVTEWEAFDQSLEACEIAMKDVNQHATSSKELIEAIEAHKAEESRVTDAIKSLEVFCGQTAEEIKKVRTDAETQLTTVLDPLENAFNTIQRLDKRDMCEFFSMVKAPPAVMHVMHATCILLGSAPSETSSLEATWKEELKTYRAKEHLIIQRMLDFDKDNIDIQALKRTESFVADESLAPENLCKYSRVSEACCKWVRCMHIYNNLAERIGPLRSHLRVGERRLEAALKSLSGRQKRLADLLDAVRDLERKLEAQMHEPHGE